VNGSLASRGRAHVFFFYVRYEFENVQNGVALTMALTEPVILGPPAISCENVQESSQGAGVPCAGRTLDRVTYPCPKGPAGF